MAIKSSAFGRTELSGKDAARFIQHMEEDKPSEWHSASYSEQSKMCESIANALNKPNVTAPDLCVYLPEMSSGGEADFMRISQMAAL